MPDEKKFFQKLLPSGSDSNSERTHKIILLSSVAAVLVLCCALALHLLLKNNGDSLTEQLETAVPEIITTVAVSAEPPETEPPPPPLVLLERFIPYIESNEHTAGWLKVGGTSIDDIVVQNEDNEFYLDHSFAGKESQAGTIFADWRCVVNDYDWNQSDNIILYGHNQKDGSMFGTLQRYKVKSTSRGNFQFYLKNPTFTFSNLYEEYTYKIIAIFVIEVDEWQTRNGIVWDYHNYVLIKNMPQPRDYASWEENLINRTAVSTGVDFNEDDKFMTLSTCSNEFEPSRFVVIGRRVRDGEDPNVDTSAASVNENAIEPDYNYILSR
jgi:sortase B